MDTDTQYNDFRYIKHMLAPGKGKLKYAYSTMYPSFISFNHITFYFDYTRMKSNDLFSSVRVTR